MTPAPRRTLRIEASAALVKALINAAAAGLRPHCSDVGLGELWLSDDEHERAEAAKLCGGCPVFEPCGDAAEANGEKFGTWSGVDRTPPKPVPAPKPRGHFDPPSPQPAPEPHMAPPQTDMRQAAYAASAASVRTQPPSRRTA
jgi:hypothetical protein